MLMWSLATAFAAMTTRKTVLEPTIEPVEDAPAVRVLMARCDGDEPKVFFLVSLLDAPDWIASGYRAVMYDLDDAMALAAWEAER